VVRTEADFIELSKRKPKGKPKEREGLIRKARLKEKAQGGEGKGEWR